MKRIVNFLTEDEKETLSSIRADVGTLRSEAIAHLAAGLLIDLDEQRGFKVDKLLLHGYGLTFEKL